MDRPSANQPSNSSPVPTPTPSPTRARAARETTVEPAGILIVAADSSARGAIVAQLAAAPHRCRCEADVAGAMNALAQDRFDLLLLDPNVSGGDVMEMAGRLRTRSPHAKVIVISTGTAHDDAIKAMRLGAVDFVTLPAEPADLSARCDAALAKSRDDRRREEHVATLRSLCQKLHIARRDVASQVDSLCRDLADAYQDLSLQMNDIAMASEFRTMLRQELDVEDLLRTALEYMLTKIGPTNAAVFLPDAGGQYSLGAYVNYDCPRESISVLLDHLGMTVCPRMADQTRVLEFADARAFSKWMGFDAALLAEAHVKVLACRHKSECLAVLILFRGKTEPYGSDLIQLLEVLRPILAEQIANVIRIHHRAGAQWPAEPDADDEYDFDDGEYGLGGLAA